MIFDSKNISLNCFWYLTLYYVLFSYICTECIKAIHSTCKIPFHLLVNSGGWFFYAIKGKSVFLAFQTQKESPNFRPYGLLDQANNLLRLLGGVRSTDDDEQSSEPFRGFGGFSSLLLNLNNTEMEFKQPRKFPEANMQAELYRQLTNRGINCYLEYPLTKVGYGKLRADCIILDKEEKNILAVIEVKSFRNPKGKPSEKSDQRKRYKVFYEDEGIPFFYVYNLGTIFKLIDWIKKSHPRYWMVDAIKAKNFIYHKEYSDWNDILLTKLEMIDKHIIDAKIRRFIKDMIKKANFNIPITQKQANYIHVLFDKKKLKELK